MEHSKIQVVSKSIELPALQFPDVEESSAENTSGSGQVTTIRKMHDIEEKVKKKNMKIKQIIILNIRHQTWAKDN